MDSSSYGVESFNSSTFGSTMLDRDDISRPAGSPPAGDPPPAAGEHVDVVPPGAASPAPPPPGATDLDDRASDDEDSMPTPSLAHLHEPYFPDAPPPSPPVLARDPPPVSPPPAIAHHQRSPPASLPKPPPITPSSPSPTLLASSWTTPLSSSLCSLSSLSGPSSPGGPASLSPTGDGGGSNAGAGRASGDRPPMRSGYPSSASDDDAQLDQRSSNGNLVLPTLPSSLASTLKASLDVGAQHRRPPARRRLRLAVVGAEEGGRGWLVSRLAEVLDLQRAGGWQTTAEGELLGLTSDGLGGAAEDAVEELEIVLSLHPVAPTSIGDLETRIRLLHSPLLQQLAPLVGGLGVADLVELAGTGKGRGADGWVDCVLVLVDSERMEDTLLAAAHLSYLAPTLLLSLPALALPPLVASAAHPAPPFFAISPESALPTDSRHPTLSLLALDPLRALFLAPAGRARLALEAGQGFGRHLASLLVEDPADDQPTDGNNADGARHTDDDDLGSSIHTSLYSYIPPSTSSPSQSFILGPKLEDHSFSPAARSAVDADVPFDPLFLPATIRALAARLGTCSPWARSCLVLGAGLCVWGWLAAVYGAAVVGQGHIAGKGGWSALAARVALIF